MFGTRCVFDATGPPPGAKTFHPQGPSRGSNRLRIVPELSRDPSDSLISLVAHAPSRKQMVDDTQEIAKGLEGGIQGLTDKHSQLDLRLRGLTLSMGDSRLSVKVSGDVIVAVHMRDLTEDEKAAHAASNVASIRS